MFSSNTFFGNLRLKTEEELKLDKIEFEKSKKEIITYLLEKHKKPIEHLAYWMSIIEVIENDKVGILKISSYVEKETLRLPGIDIDEIIDILIAHNIVRMIMDTGLLFNEGFKKYSKNPIYQKCYYALERNHAELIERSDEKIEQSVAFDRLRDCIRILSNHWWPALKDGFTIDGFYFFYSKDGFMIRDNTKNYANKAGKYDELYFVKRDEIMFPVKQIGEKVIQKLGKDIVKLGVLYHQKRLQRIVQ